MDESTVKQKSFKYLLVMLIFIALTDISFFFNISILRQITGFVFLTFVPGLLILHILKLQRLKMAEKFVISVGLSIATLLFTGIIINFIYPLLGYSTPLSPYSVVITLSVVTVILTLIAYFRNRTQLNFTMDSFQLTIKEKSYLLFPVLFPLIAIVGILWMNHYSNNSLVILLISLITAYIVFLTVYSKNTPEKIYPPIIMCISVALVLLLALRSNHILGADIHTEYYVFLQTMLTGKWHAVAGSALDGCLSISILPAIYQSFLHINSEYLYKLLYPVLFSASPIIVYLIAKKYLNSIYAFLATIFYISQYYFLNAEFSPRTIIALLFFALSIMVIFNDSLKSFERYFLLGSFSISVIISHYSTANIFLLLLLFTFLLERLFHIFATRRRKSSQIDHEKYRIQYNINFWVMLSYFAFLVLWDTVVSNTIFRSTMYFFSETLKSIETFFDISQRGSSAVILGVGITNGGLARQFIFYISWLAILLLAVGLLIVLFNYRKTVAHDSANQENIPEFLIRKLDAEFLIMALVGSFILVVAVAVPFIMVGYDMQRVFIQTIVILSPFFIIGSIAIADIFKKYTRVNIRHFVILSALILYFLSSTGLTYQIFGIQQALTLNSAGADYDEMYVHDQETTAAAWLNSDRDQSLPVFSDFYGSYRLISQGGIFISDYAGPLIEKKAPISSGYFFLRYTGVVNGKIMDQYLQWHSLSDYQDYFSKLYKIYSDGGATVYY